jgi:osmotically inducible lipoprotein OsmB
MKSTRWMSISAVLCVASALSACSNMSPRERDTVVGAAIGGVAGSVLTDGSAAGTVGGAAVGGVIGNQVGKDRQRKR